MSQPQGILGGSTRLRTLSFDCRGHGHTEPLGPPDQLKFSTFADDLRAVLDALVIEVLIVGGISMGAGVALNFTLRNPLRVQALILSRPAWLDAPFPPNLEIFRSLSRWLNEGGPRSAKERLLADSEFRRIQTVSRDNAASILRQLERPSLEATSATLASLPADTPCATPEAWREVAVPTMQCMGLRYWMLSQAAIFCFLGQVRPARFWRNWSSLTEPPDLWSPRRLDPS